MTDALKMPRLQLDLLPREADWLLSIFEIGSDGAEHHAVSSCDRADISELIIKMSKLQEDIELYKDALKNAKKT